MITYEVENSVYEALAQRIFDKLSGNYLNTVIELVDGDVEITFKITAVAYYRKNGDVSGDWEELTDLVPIWWECHTYLYGNEIINNVSFNVLKDFILK